MLGKTSLTTARVFLLTLSVSMLILGAHGAEAAKYPSEKSDITLGLPVNAVTFLPIHVARDQGYFKDEGITLTVVIFRGGTAMVKGLIADSVDVGLTAFAGVSVGIKARQPLKVFYGGYNMPVFEWWAIPRIKTMKDSKGARYGVSRIGSSTDFLTRFALLANGLDPTKDVQIIQGGASSSRLAAMDAGQLDVNIFSSPEKFKAADRGYKQVLRQSDLADDYPFHVFFAKTAFIDSHPNTIKSLLRAQIRGIRAAKANPALARRVLEKQNKMEPKYSKRTYEDFIDKIFENGRMPSKKGMRVFFEQGILSGTFKAPWPESRYLDRRFISTYDAWKP